MFGTRAVGRRGVRAAAACVFSLGFGTFLAGAAEGPPRTGIAGCDVTRPTGDYALVVLELSAPGMPKSADPGKREALAWTYVGGLRAGRMRVDDGIGLREPGGWLEFKDGRLTGRFHRADRRAEVSLDAAVSGGAITGAARVGDRTATVSGRYVAEAELAARNAVPRDKSWPAAQGPLMGGCSAEPTGAATIEDPSALRLVWRSEESDIGRGMGNITRFMHTWGSASTRRTGSGCASPIVADGKVFFKYFVPAPREPHQPEMAHPNYGATEAQGLEKMLQEAKAAGWTGEALPPCAAEKMYQNVNDIVLAMDAATGKTLWKAVVKKRPTEGAQHPNSQHHKAGPFDMSPACGGGRVFALGMTGWLYAFDADTGTPLWEVEAERDYSNALLAVGGVVVAPAKGQWGGYDAATGRLLWTAGAGRAMSTLSAWSNAGKDYLIGLMGPNHARAGVACLDAGTGQKIWDLPVNVMTGGRGLGPGGITVFGDTLLVYQDNGTGKKGDPIKPAVAAYRLTPAGPEPIWQATAGPAEDPLRSGPAHGESVPVVVRGKYVFTADLRTLDLATGKGIGRAEGEDLVRPMNGGYMQAIEDLVLVRRDGTHGNMECGFYKVGADGRVRPLTGAAGWVPPIGGTTTSYHHPIFYPMVAGRIFFRQENGVYCWDARAAP